MHYKEEVLEHYTSYTPELWIKIVYVEEIREIYRNAKR